MRRHRRVDLADSRCVFIANNEDRDVACLRAFADCATGADRCRQRTQQGKTTVERIKVIVLARIEILCFKHQTGFAVAEFNANPSSSEDFLKSFLQRTASELDNLAQLGSK